MTPVLKDFRVLLATAFSALLLATAAWAASSYSLEPSIDRSGNDIAVIELAVSDTADTCGKRCAATRGCLAFTYVKQSASVPKPICRLKDEKPYGHESSCCISGVIKQ